MADKLRTIIIEDEELARSLLKSYLGEIDEIEVVAECQNGFEGVKMINELKPDLIFLDIQMPKITGFEMLELIDHKPEIIFTTAYDQYALKAFEIHAADYLLKPFSKDRLLEAVKKVIDRVNRDGVTGDIVDRVAEFTPGEYLDRIVVKDRHKIHIAPVDQVRYIESMDDYVMVYTKDGRFM